MFALREMCIDGMGVLEQDVGGHRTAGNAYRGHGSSISEELPKTAYSEVSASYGCTEVSPSHSPRLDEEILHCI